VVFAFGDYVLDVERCELHRGGEPVALEPLVFDLLVYLVSGSSAPRDDSMEQVVPRGAISSRPPDPNFQRSFMLR
jgi:DNA-binding winged helix-turn-helix (wHTH) protein